MSARPAPAYPGMVFGYPWIDPRITVVHREDGPREVVYGNVHVPRHEQRAWAFAAVRLDRMMPHIVLENLRGGGLIACSVGLPDGKRLRLEGDFDRTFALHVAEGYETDALYLFTPDVMERVLTIPAKLDMDVEIVDDWLLIYSPIPIVSLEAAAGVPVRETSVLPALEALVAGLTPKIGGWGRWSDHREPDAGAVSPAGRRMPRPRGRFDYVVHVLFWGGLAGLFWLWWSLN
ncbi:hypothetical protein ELQ90_15895 [Labedella phragmitis]|uniref:Uncharacterized protein n=1 Tax=Labedella phragmitis TaxID=2498849 RepID=A0A3S4AE31_9MICO|nr:hypothetical protein [Labedella phragmitis]RWZ46250.1 hypothetical protein ELQ90_15895 [Labedella phragmitis]